MRRLRESDRLQQPPWDPGLSADVGNHAPGGAGREWKCGCRACNEGVALDQLHQRRVVLRVHQLQRGAAGASGTRSCGGISRRRRKGGHSNDGTSRYGERWTRTLAYRRRPCVCRMLEELQGVLGGRKTPWTGAWAGVRRPGRNQVWGRFLPADGILEDLRQSIERARAVDRLAAEIREAGEGMTSQQEIAALNREARRRGMKLGSWVALSGEERQTILHRAEAGQVAAREQKKKTAAREGRRKQSVSTYGRSSGRRQSFLRANPAGKPALFT